MNWERCATQLAYVALVRMAVSYPLPICLQLIARADMLERSDMNKFKAPYPETKKSHLKIDVWNTNLSLLRKPSRGQLFVSEGFTMTLRRFKRMERKRSYRQMGADISIDFSFGMSRSIRWDVWEGHGESS